MNKLLEKSIEHHTGATSKNLRKFSFQQREQ